jgi:DNA-binding CsgD family transcriptional regulator
VVRPFNQRAVELFTREAIREDMLHARPSHPLSTYVRQLLDGEVDASTPNVAIVTFPSGAPYRVEASQRSKKGRDRLLMLLLQNVADKPAIGQVLDGHDFTPREREIAQRMIGGASSDEICTELDIGLNTLKTHVKNLLAKTRTRNRTELVAKLLGA